MTLAIDTNVFVYAHYDLYPEHVKARRFLEDLMSRGEPFYLSWQVYYEYVRIVTHPKVHKKPCDARTAQNDMMVYLSRPQCRMLHESEDHAAVLTTILRSLPAARGNFIHDCHYAVLLKENGVTRIATADMDFRKFDFLDVINPVI